MLRGRRRTARRRVLVALAAFGAIVGAGVAGTVGYLVDGSDAGVRDLVTSASPTDAALQISAEVDDEPAMADQVVRDAVARSLPDVAHEVRLSVRADPGRVELPGAGVQRAAVIAYDGLRDHADLVEGRWPGRSDSSERLPVVAHARAAAELGLRVGDEVTLATHPVTLLIEGLWLPRESDAPVWFGDELEVSGADGRVDLLFALPDADPTSLRGFGALLRWRVIPAADELGARDIEAAITGLSGLQTRLRGDTRLADAAPSVEGGLVRSLRSAQAGIRAVTTVAAVGLVHLTVVMVLALGAVAGWSHRSREQEAALLHARGASTVQQLRWTLAETVPVLGLPALLGAALAVIGLAVTGVAGRAPTWVVPVGVVAILVAGGSAVLLVVAWWRLARSRRVEVVFRDRGERIAAIAAPLLVGVVAAVSTWQLLRYGGPAVPDASGTPRADPVAVSAPAAILLLVGVVAVGGLAGLGFLGARMRRRGQGINPLLPARRLASRPMRVAVPVVLLVAAAGSGTLAASFSGTWSELQRDLATELTGADVRVRLEPTSGSAALLPHPDLRAYREGADDVQVVPVATGLAAMSDGRAGFVAVGEDARSSQLPGIDLAADARSLTLHLDVEVAHEIDEAMRERLVEAAEELHITFDDEGPHDLRLDTAVWLEDAEGLLTLVDLDRLTVGPERATASDALEVVLPEGPGPWRVVGLEVGIDAMRVEAVRAWWSRSLEVTVTAIELGAEGERIDLTGERDWVLRHRSADPATRAPELVVAARGVGLRLESRGEVQPSLAVRLTPGVAVEDAPLPVVASAAALDAFGLDVGDEVVVEVFGSDLPVVITDRADRVPGTGQDAVLQGELGALLDRQLRTGARVPAANEIRLGADGDLAAGELEQRAVAVADPDAAIVSRARVEDELRDDAFAGIPSTILWSVGGTTAAIAVLGLAVAGALGRHERRVELRMLRTIGATPRELAGLFLLEQVAVVVVALVAGAAGGWLVASLVAAPLAEAVTDGPLQGFGAVPTLAVVPWAGYLAALASAATGVAVAQARVLRREIAGTVRGGG